MLLLTMLTFGTAAAAAPSPWPFAVLRAADARLAAIGYRLARANQALCRDIVPVPGMAIHAIDQYDPSLRPQARQAFGFETPVAIEAVVPGSAAAAAGIVQDDSVVAVGDRAIDTDVGVRAGAATRDRVQALLEQQPATLPLTLTLLRHGLRRTVSIAASPGCRSRFEVVLDRGMLASADGLVVQIGVRFLERYSDDQVAVVAAHELSHDILDHRRRLDAAGVKRGVWSEVGRSGRLIRRTEVDADLLSVHLLRNAGYDPGLAVRFWREHGGDVDGGLFRSRTHPSSRARADLIAQEIGQMATDASAPSMPQLLATRDTPLS